MTKWGMKCPYCGKMNILPIRAEKGSGAKIQGPGKVVTTCVQCGKQIESAADDVVKLES